MAWLQTGYRQILAGERRGQGRHKTSWTAFLRELKERGLKGVKLFVSDKWLGLVENLAEFYPEAKWQRCVVHFYRNVWMAVPTGKVKEVAVMLKAVHAQEDAQAAREKRRTGGGEAEGDEVGAGCGDRRSRRGRNVELLRDAV